MKNKLLAVAATALMTLSMSSAQATTLTFNGLYQTTDQVDLFYFDNSSVGDVDIWADTLQDGLSQIGSLFVKNTGTGDWNWTGRTIEHAVADDYDPVSETNSSGFNNYGVAMKNGYIHGVQGAVGISDVGETVLNLGIGSYMVVLSEDFNYAASVLGGSAVFDGAMSRQLPFLNWKNQAWSTGVGVDAPYELYVSGDGVAEVSAVPVPAAVWLFTSAMAGLSVIRRKNSKSIA